MGRSRGEWETHAIGFLGNSGTDPPRVQLLLEGGSYDPL